MADGGKVESCGRASPVFFGSSGVIGKSDCVVIEKRERALGYVAPIRATKSNSNAVLSSTRTTGVNEKRTRKFEAAFAVDLRLGGVGGIR